MTQTVSPEDALIYCMVSMSAVDSTMSDAELLKIGDLVRALPVFAGYNQDRLSETAEAASAILNATNGLDAMLETVADAIPEKLYDTAYALAVEVASADLSVRAEELRFLQLLRDRFNLSKLTVAALERSAMARYRRQ